MTGDGRNVSTVVMMHLVLADATVLPITAELSYGVADPYTVRAVFSGPHSVTTWLIGRELIAKGLDANQDEPSGDGDVQVWRDEDPEFVLIAVSGAEGNALLAAPAAEVEEFIARTAELVEFGAESELMTSQISDFITSLLTT